MTPAEVSILIEAKRSKMVGNIHEDDFDALVERREALIAEGIETL